MNLGIMDYGQCLVVQRTHHERVKRGAGGIILYVQHPPVITLGKNSSDHHLLFAEKELDAQGIALYSTERGGEVTGHEPGQLVGYPILPLPALNLTPKKYVLLLQNSIIETLSLFGIGARADAKHPGVWLTGRENAKICSIGIRIKQRVSMHGFALNVDNELTTFKKIVPCGISGCQMVSMASLGCAEGIDTVRASFHRVFVKNLRSRSVAEHATRHLPSTDEESIVSH